MRQPGSIRAGIRANVGGNSTPAHPRTAAIANARKRGVYAASSCAYPEAVALAHTVLTERSFPLGSRAVRLILLLLLLLAVPVAAQAQFTFTTNNGAITITGYTGPGGVVVIPSATNGLPVTSIADLAFDDITNLTSVTIPDT